MFPQKHCNYPAIPQESLSQNNAWVWVWAASEASPTWAGFLCGGISSPGAQAPAKTHPGESIALKLKGTLDFLTHLLPKWQKNADFLPSLHDLRLFILWPPALLQHSKFPIVTQTSHEVPQSTPIFICAIPSSRNASTIPPGLTTTCSATSSLLS